MSFWKKYRKLHIWLAVDLAVLGLYLALRQNRQLMNGFANHVTGDGGYTAPFWERRTVF